MMAQACAAVRVTDPCGRWLRWRRHHVLVVALYKGYDHDPMPVPGEYVEAFARKGFRLVSDIGSGLSGTVFRATQESLARDVAIKVFDNPIGSADMNLRKRFVREAQLLARVSHPSIPVVLTRGTITVAHKEVPYTAMQLIDGINLATVIEAERRLPYRKAVEIVAQVLAALSASHTARSFIET
jgi:serine/threonine protein kinase